MKATLIINAKNGDVANVIRGKLCPAQERRQKKEFIHMAVDLPESELIELDNKDEKTRTIVDIDKQLDPITLVYAKEPEADIPLVGDFKTPIVSITKKIDAVDVKVVK